VNGVAEADASAAAAVAETGVVVDPEDAGAALAGAALAVDAGRDEPDLVAVPISLAGPPVAAAAEVVETEAAEETAVEAAEETADEAAADEAEETAAVELATDVD